MGKPLVEYAEGAIGMGVKSGLAKAFVLDRATTLRLAGGTLEGHPLLKPFLGGKEIQRYRIASSDQFLIYTRHGEDLSRYPSILAHLEPYRRELEARATEQAWYELQQPQEAYAERMEGTKIVFPDIAKQPRFALDTGHYVSNTCYFIAREDRALLALLNSRVAHFYFIMVCAGLEGAGETYLRFFGQYLAGFPVPPLGNRGNLEGWTARIEQLLVPAGGPTHSTTARRREVAALEREIDAVSYELYQLTDAEIRLIEDATAPALAGRSAD